MNWKENKYAERLIKEWHLHGKIVLACDFDDTIFGWGFKTPEDEAYFKYVIGIVKKTHDIGAWIVIWSACDPERYQEIVSYCAEIGLHIDAINENPISLPYGKHKKIYYNHLLDDRAGLDQALDMLEYCAYRVQTEKHPITEQNVEF